MIKSFADKRVAAIFAGYAVCGLPLRIQPWGRAKLLMIAAAKQIEDSCVPPGNRLEVLRGDGQSQHSIRINDQPTADLLRIARWRGVGRRHRTRAPGGHHRHRDASRAVLWHLAKVLDQFAGPL